LSETERIRIANLDGGYPSYEAEHKLLGDLGCTYDVFSGDRHDRDGKLRFAQGAKGIFLRWTKLDGQALDAMPSVRYVVRYGVGYDNVDLEAAAQRGVLVCNVQGYANDAVSDHALAFLLASLRGLKAGRERLLTHYTSAPRQNVRELRELTVGVVGLGRIGSAFCRKVRPLVQQTLACDPYVDDARFSDLGVERRSFEQLLPECHAISIHCNLTPETKGMFDAGAFKTMRNDAVLINTARGPVVDEDALEAALTAGEIQGAGLDVWTDEPPRENRRALLDHPEVEVTGHYAWYSQPASKELQRRAAANMAAMLQGRTPEDCLNPDAAGR
jgi:D-3-phosphoglycerate dehydrogenase